MRQAHSVSKVLIFPEQPLEIDFAGTLAQDTAAEFPILQTEMADAFHGHRRFREKTTGGWFG
jgi:hypothetical protein